MTFSQRRDLAERLRAIPLERVLPLCGGQPDRDDRHKWHTPAGTLSVTGVKFMNWTLGRGGGGAIDLVIHLHAPRLQSRRRLAGLPLHRWPPAAGTNATPARLPIRTAAPQAGPGQLTRVRDYLIVQRRLPSGLVASLLDSGTLYADARANAVFLLCTEHQVPVGAELRGTTPRAWRGLAPGSRKDLGCFAVPCPTHGPTQSSFANQPLTPSVALPSIPDTGASPPPAPAPTLSGCGPFWINVVKFTAASTPIPPATPWLPP